MNRPTRSHIKWTRKIFKCKTKRRELETKIPGEWGELTEKINLKNTVII